MAIRRRIDPSRVSGLGGYLGTRILANRDAKVKKREFFEPLILQHEKKNYVDWFWMGEQIGKWLDASAHTCLATGDDQLRATVEEVLSRLAASQESDGYLGITSRFQRNPVRGMQLYEWYYVLLGLLACHELLQSSVALEIAVKLGHFIMRHWGTESDQFPLVGRYPGNGHDGGEGTLILEPMVLLGIAAGDDRFIKWGEATLAKWDEWFAAHPESVHTGSLSLMREVADGLRDVHEIRHNIHAHTLHMTLLGLAALHEATGNPEYRRITLGCIENIRTKYVFLTGGMSAGERYVPFRYYNAGHDVEVCPQHTWILLLMQAWEWTGEACYAEELERTLYNSMLAAQLADGSNWSYMVPMNGRAQEPVGPNCCNAAGMRTVAQSPAYLYGTDDSGSLWVLQYVESRCSHMPGVTVTVATAYPSEGSVRLTVNTETPASFVMQLRIPSFAITASLEINGVAMPTPSPGSFAEVAREWQDGDVVDLILPMPISVHAGSRRLAITRGPLVYAYFHSWQEDPKFAWVERAYPEDIVLRLDPASPLTGLREVPAPDGCLGPAFMVSGGQYRDPIFVEATANERFPEYTPLDVLLLPFVNQGSRRGHYSVFMSYEPTTTE